MAQVYHINGDSVSPCRAQKGQCPFGKGDQENHFASANEAMAVLEERLSQEYGDVNSISKKTKSQGTAKELAAQGADPKEVRDALRRENPTWPDRRIHTVEKQMTKTSTPSVSTTPTSAISPHVVKALHQTLSNAKAARERCSKELTATVQQEKLYDDKYGVSEWRAYHYDYASGIGEVMGEHPSGGPTFYTRHPKWAAARKQAEDTFKKAVKDEKDAQTAIEEAGLGHTIPDEGNTIRVKTQAQKWLLENELLGQISDGKWENSGPDDHWKDWSSAKVIVDPQNVGRNFRPKKDNYQLNATDLLDVVGDRMVEDVKEQTGKDYDSKAMMKDLRDLRNIFKTHRGTVA